jgi:hypothetical protein
MHRVGACRFGQLTCIASPNKNEMAAIRLGYKIQAGAVRLAQLAGDEQPKSGSEMVRGEERLKYLRSFGLRHATAIVDNVQFNRPGHLAGICPQANASGQIPAMA